MDISVQNGGLTNFVGYEEGYRLIREAGFDGIDWNIDMEWKNKEINQRILSECIFTRSQEEIMAHFQEELAVIKKKRPEDFQIGRAHV